MRGRYSAEHAAEVNGKIDALRKVQLVAHAPPRKDALVGPAGNAPEGSHEVMEGPGDGYFVAVFIKFQLR